LKTITWLPERGRHGISNVIVAMLSLVLVVIVVANIVLWNYQMNGYDWDKMRENIDILAVSRISHSPWFFSKSEFAVDAGACVNGSYTDTYYLDNNYESFSGNLSTDKIYIRGDYALNLSVFPLVNASALEMQMRFKANDTADRFYLKAYDWNSSVYSNVGFNSTSDSISSHQWSNYSVKVTGNWNRYVGSSGLVRIAFADEGSESNLTRLDVDFLAVRLVINGTKFDFQNKGPLTSHLVALWLDNSTIHQRYQVSLFINEGENCSYFRSDVNLPSDSCIIKAVSERGNVAVFTTN
jgi:hypothetical protein